MQPIHPNGRRAGFTLIEVVAAVCVLGLVISSIAQVTNSTLGLYGEANARTLVEARARAGIDRITFELENAGLTTLAPDPGLVGNEVMAFQTTTGTTAGVIDWSAQVQLVLEYEPGETDNDLDDDGDGLVDEGRVVLVRNHLLPSEKRVTLCRGVREYLDGETLDGFDENGNGLVDERGFVLQREEDVITIRLTLAHRSKENRVLTSTVETAVRLRN